MKKKKMINMLFLNSFFFLIFSQITANEEEKNKQAFYAISSLRFYLDEVFSSDGEKDGIVFEEDDVNQLWSQAMHSSFLAQIQLVKDDYEQALKQNSSELLIEAKDILDDVWEKLNSEFLNHDEGFSVSFRFPSFIASAHSLTNVELPSGEEGDRIRSYFLPDDHWLKAKLDKIFAQPGVLENKTSFKKAGFITLHRQASGMRVASHPLIPGYLVKVFFNSNSRNQDWKWPIARCKGAENIRNLIKKENLRYFTVPDKWIYLVPGSSLSHPEWQASVLVVTDMNLVSREASKRAWKNATAEHLKELYCILSHGFASCYLPYNIPYTKEGTYACVDTAYPQRKHHYESARHYFSDEMKLYWDKLVKKGGNP
jgi:hypothetical protein